MSKQRNQERKQRYQQMRTPSDTEARNRQLLERMAAGAKARDEQDAETRRHAREYQRTIGQCECSICEAIR